MNTGPIKLRTEASSKQEESMIKYNEKSYKDEDMREAERMMNSSSIWRAAADNFVEAKEHRKRWREEEIEWTIRPSKIWSCIDKRWHSDFLGHLASNGMTAEEYRKRYRLPENYPVVLQEYQKKKKNI